jgi:hypothetical protein
MKFSVAINCMDGRAQLPVIEFLKKRFNADFVDCVTEAAPAQILAGETNRRQVQSIIDRIDLSITQHKPVAIAIIACEQCPGDSADKQKQLERLDLSVKFLKRQYSSVEVIGLWIDKNWAVNEISST